MTKSFNNENKQRGQDKPELCKQPPTILGMARTYFGLTMFASELLFT